MYFALTPYFSIYVKEIIIPTSEHYFEGLKKKSLKITSCSMWHLEALSNARSPFQLCPLHASNATPLALTQQRDYQREYVVA